MRGRIWGCRGSLATPGAATTAVGGNTSCVELRADGGAVVVIDAGTGIRPLGVALAQEGVREVDLLLSHLHLDHIEGLGFFSLIFDPACTVRIWGPADAVPLRDRIAGYLSPPLFPLRFEELPARIEFAEVGDADWEIGGLTMSAARLCHPGPTLGYRITERGRSLAYISDNEPALDRSAGVELAQGADLLLHDAQYTDEEYRTRSGWGHASVSDFAAFVLLTEPRGALMFHHDPAHSDSELEALEHVARQLSERSDVRLARDGMPIELD
jgi:phosphoribosyl 1,2-cyclic phosphodiesterase